MTPSQQQLAYKVGNAVWSDVNDIGILLVLYHLGEQFFLKNVDLREEYKKVKLN